MWPCLPTCKANLAMKWRAPQDCFNQKLKKTNLQLLCQCLCASEIVHSVISEFTTLGFPETVLLDSVPE